MDEIVWAKVDKTDNESAVLDFKTAFDPAAAQDWCERVKDIVAMANSGGVNGSLRFDVIQICVTMCT